MYRKQSLSFSSKLMCISNWQTVILIIQNTSVLFRVPSVTFSGLLCSLCWFHTTVSDISGFSVFEEEEYMKDSFRRNIPLLIEKGSWCWCCCLLVFLLDISYHVTPKCSALDYLPWLTKCIFARFSSFSSLPVPLQFLKWWFVTHQLKHLFVCAF